MESRHRYNSFLDQINDGFYRPRGLYCMVLTWNPESDNLEVGVNINETIQSNLTPPEVIAQQTKQSLRPFMGKTNGIAFTESAPLVFPALDTLAGSNSQESKTQKEKLKCAANFTGDYFDRRANAKYAADNPDSRLLVGPKPMFTSRYSDPNNPSNSGDMLALLTGGKFTRPPRGGFGGGARGFGRRGMGMGAGFGVTGMGGMNSQQKYPNQQYPNQPYPNQMQSYAQQHPNQSLGYYGGVGGMTARPGTGIGFGGPTMLLGEGIKRILNHHVLYLLVVNMPTDEELAEATRLVADQT